MSSLENYFGTNVLILKISGLWVPRKGDPYRIPQIVCNYFWLIWLSLYQPTETAMMFDSENLIVFVRSLRDQLNHFCCIFKMSRWFVYRVDILNAMHVLQDADKRFTYEEFDEFDSEEIFSSRKKQADRWVLLFFTFCNLICLNMFCLVVYVFYWLQNEQYVLDVSSGTRIYAQKMPVDLKTPFANTTRTSFMLHFIFEIISLTVYAWMIVGLDGLFTSLMSCVGAHLVVIQNAFKTIRPRCLKRLRYDGRVEFLKDDARLETEMRAEMKKCVVHLQTIIKISAEIEKIYNLQTCVQVLVSLFEMCFCLYLLSTSFNESMGPELTYLVSTSFELLLYCWFGNSVTEASAAIPETIYSGDWLSSGGSFKRSMLITMTRMKRPIFMSIGKFTPLTFTTFLSIARVAYSFFTVLKSQSLS